MTTRNQIMTTYRAGDRRFVTAGERGRRGDAAHILIFTELGGKQEILNLRDEQARQLMVSEQTIPA